MKDNLTLEKSEVVMDLEKENFLITILLRFNYSYVDYDDYLKKYVNITSY